MAAGKGTRMLPVTQTIPKVLIPVGNKPFLHHLIKNIHQAGIKDIAIITSYKSEMVEQFLNEYDIKATIIDQGIPEGTGHAISKVNQFTNNENFLAFAGDNLWSTFDIRQMIQHDDLTYVAAFKVQDPSKYGVLVTKDDKLVEIKEKPEEFVGDTINSSLYKFTPQVFEELKNITKSKRGEYEITDALTSLAKKNQVKVYTIQDYWMDLGSLEDIPNVDNFLQSLQTPDQ